MAQGASWIGPTPMLDHVIVVVDTVAYQSLIGETFLSEHFARVRLKRATSTFAGTYTSLGVGGTNTLIEFFDVAAPPLAGLTGGLVLSFERPGSAVAARARLEACGAAADYDLIERDVTGNGDKRPWYHMVRPDLGAHSPFLLTLAEVTAEYFAHLGAQVGPQGELYRRAYLDCALGAPRRPEHQLGDVVEVAVQLRPERADRVATALTALGFDVVDRAEGRTLTSADATIHLYAGEDAEGVLSIGMRLERASADDQRHHFGSTSVLSFAGGQPMCVWSFTPPASTRGEP